ncbi:MAG TPA: hypothetical protein PKA00_02635 [Saprospiraceae bacterium]|nr:hypothetical protein [Saprospiraceae bacterium]HMQ81770.1 hypothetical protein [Saprospiraceae bacterium]
MLWVLLILLLILTILLLLPIEVEMDTKKDIYRAAWKGIVGLRVVPDSEQWHWYFQFFFIQKEWHWTAEKSQPKAAKTAKTSPRKQKKRSMSARQMWALFKNMLRAITIKRLEVNWDTDDYVRNAYLFPLFLMASKGRRQLRINFKGEHDIAIFLQTRLGRIAWAFLRVFIHPKIT